MFKVLNIQLICFAVILDLKPKRPKSTGIGCDGALFQLHQILFSGHLFFIGINQIAG